MPESNGREPDDRSTSHAPASHIRARAQNASGFVGDGGAGVDAGGRVADGLYVGERISHLGIAVNPLVTGTIGWTIVDEHRSGAVFLALGENRYMGGDNESAINVDLMPASPTVVVDGTVLVNEGVLIVGSR
jgi:hypothetical protein